MMLEFKKRILLVEDEAVIAMTTAKALEQEYDVMTAFKGEEAVELVRSGEKIDLILMDINLGMGMDGTEAAEIILRDHFIPVVFLSSHAERAVVEKTEKITSYGYVLKDPRYTVLFAAIRMAFRLHEARKAVGENLDKYRILNDRLQLALSSAHIGTWDLDVPRNDLVWDELMFQLYGLRREDFSGDFESWSGLIHPEDDGRFQAAMQAALRDENEFEVEFRIVRPTGEIRHIKALGQVLRDADGRPLRMTGVNIDVTHEKHNDA
jgi:PAS domain S-box-containing protein